MSDPSYQEYCQNLWDKHLDASFDDPLNLALKNGLTWLPWVGKDYNATNGRLLIVGESHYSGEPDIEKVAQNKAKMSANQKETREVIAEYPLEGLAAGWERNNPTYDNLHRALLKTDLLSPDDKTKRVLLWRQISYYNFVQRPMDCGDGRRERPIPGDYLKGWPIFIRLITILRPKTCVFIGVEASNVFNRAMKDLGIKHSPILRGEFLNDVYTRIGGGVTICGVTTNIICMKHTSQYFSWQLWNKYLERIMPENMAHFRQVVLDGEPKKQEEFF